MLKFLQKNYETAKWMKFCKLKLDLDYLLNDDNNLTLKKQKFFFIFFNK